MNEIEYHDMEMWQTGGFNIKTKTNSNDSAGLICNGQSGLIRVTNIFPLQQAVAVTSRNTRCMGWGGGGGGGGEIRLPPYDHLLLQFLLLCIRGRKIIVTTLLFNKVIQFSKILEIIGGGGVVPSVSAPGNKRRF
jgi:hypothetical protein